MTTGNDLELAADLIRKGKLVAFPTETVYGLGADAGNRDALSLLYAAKGRPSNHPVIVHLSHVEQVSDWAQNIPPEVETLAGAFWPGPLTLILKRKHGVLDEVTGGQDTVALRIPAHPLALKLLKLVGIGVAAPSANKFGRLSPTRAIDVEEEFGAELSYVVDGGPSQVGIESTIVDLSGRQKKILRPGQISRDKLAGFIKLCEPGKIDLDTPRTPGSLESHYAPSCPVILSRQEKLSSLIEKLELNNESFAVLSFNTPAKTNNAPW
ncbi:MAG: threonylcarbamoyl-AMP synthase, partial [Candidatus Obscuribacterales bacterium]|nr:threonylcarbamoyl-AMP synthase [Candidatus Obscuribacterales bacterium]